ncbi:hypothetical protein VOLCADRAFT_93295 [Volvox carteri f. nagariensis]|uniref:Uncharacterized protein n=1 Tax=Volvox carteri f. nagariensis TaxID=3068 RepID=D8U1R7_VOLCA|nr:uncharacterized protein VOLCADRAFT_93295 [Volvox carteri f. nagariensis]EFJ46388.1 hypothetical protein VOLCADRAFT_93295 [Volvox carteri f. nagariensis]|eukprot:XP_002952541.1 hypothetical protein VOLCADRAFT_93295 [Volvox carteri f. nagariensis]
MKPSMRLFSKFSEANSSWAQLITLKEALIVTLSIGSAFVVANKWATSVQLSAQAEVMASVVKAEMAGVKADIAGMKTDMKADMAVIKTDMAAMKATVLQVLEVLQTASPPKC